MTLDNLLTLREAADVAFMAAIDMGDLVRAKRLHVALCELDHEVTLGFKREAQAIFASL